MEIQYKPLSELRENEDNPRLIQEDKLGKLINSILSFPKMLEIRPVVIDANGTALGGNMRTRALNAILAMNENDIQERLESIGFYIQQDKEQQDETTQFWEKWRENPTVPVMNADNLTEEEQNKFIAVDNISFGEWDMDLLLQNYDAGDLVEWGFDESDFENVIFDSEEREEEPTQPHDKPTPGNASEGSASYNISYTLSFEDEEEQRRFFEILKFLSQDMPNEDTITKRILSALDGYISSKA